MIPSQYSIGQLADRLERAYRRRNPLWMPIGLTPGVWEAAAMRLLEASKNCPLITIDPEFYVAAQVSNSRQPDPWSELTQRTSLVRYLKGLRRIVGQLRRELKAEVRLAEDRLGRGIAIERVIASDEDRISPLTRFILAHRAGRPELSIKLRADAEKQHRSCPLYQLASRAFMPRHAYPIAEGTTGLARTRKRATFSLN